MSRAYIVGSIDDASHFTEEQKAEIIASYPEHEKEARVKGNPSLGSGRIFAVPEASIKCAPFPLPRHWPRILGIDFGWDHPAATVEVAWDRDHDVAYVVWAHRAQHLTPVEHAAIIRQRGRLPVSWPRDGKRETLEGAGVALAKQYSDNGIHMLHEHAQFEDGGVSVEAGLMMMVDRMRGGRFKVFDDVTNEWWDEYRLYHRKDGRVVKEGDDLMAATRYALMMLRHAKTAEAYRSFAAKIEPINFGFV